MDINKILELAPAKIAEFTVKENESYAEMLRTHEEYKRLWAKTFLEKKTLESKTIKELECELDILPELVALKDKEINAEIAYRGWRQKKDNARDYFNAVQEIGRTRRAEMKSLSDGI